MKKYKQVFDVGLLLSLGIMSALTIAPKTFVMSTGAQMLLLACVLGGLAAFLVILWREHPSDEREVHNQVSASRLAYIVGSVVLIITMLIESVRHDLDPAIPITLFAMIATKIIVQRTRDDL